MKLLRVERGSETREEALRCLEALAKGRVAVRPRVDSDAVLKLIGELAKLLHEEAQRRIESVVAISTSSNEVAVGILEILGTSRENSEKAQAIAAAVEEMSATIREIGGYSEQVAREAEELRQVAADGTGQVSEAVDTMGQVVGAVRETAGRIDSLAEASAQIGDIVRTIDDIAEQTKLLALNASIEAARAGEAGKGFAVVAGEVRALAQKTAEATEEVRRRIEALEGEMRGILESVQAGERSVSEAQEAIARLGGTIERMGGSIDGVTARMGEVASILGQQTQATNEISASVGAIAEAAARNRERIEAIVEASERLEEHVKHELTALGRFEFPEKILHLAKADHVLWKKRLVAMATGRSELRPEELADHRSCRLGKWYYGEGQRVFGSEPVFRNLEGAHERVHRHGIEAARRFQAGDLEGALAAIGEVEKASVEVLAALDQLLELSRRQESARRDAA